MEYAFDWAYVWQTVPLLLRGLRTTLLVSVLGLLLSLLLGFAGALLRLSGQPWLAGMAVGYVGLIRNTPFLVQVFFIYYGMPTLGVQLSAFWSGVAALGLWAGAYHVESLRAGYTGVSAGVRDAAQALALRPWQYVWTVALPLSMRVALPAMLNTSIAMFKNSAYLQAIGLAEMTFMAMDRISLDFHTIELFVAICAIYVAFVLLMSAGAGVFERRLQRPLLAR